jgi:hypothetical protein
LRSNGKVRGSLNRYSIRDAAPPLLDDRAVRSGGAEI